MPTHGHMGLPGCLSCDHNGVRCDCGNLLARVVDGRVELKCRRCKRVVILPLVEKETGRMERPMKPS